MIQTPSFYKIDKVTEENIKPKLLETGEVSIIDYKNWKTIQKKSPVYKIPIEYCLYRRDNGRIMTEVLSYSIMSGSLEDQNDDEVQKIISNFLSEKDREKNKELKSYLKKDGQTEPAIITSDGLLINGNRRKMALESLYKSDPKEEYKYLKVVVLPGSKDPERPTLRDIALLENRLQFQEMGKSDYTAMDKALKIIQNVDSGIPLQELLKDSAEFSEKSPKDFEKAVNKFKQENLEPIQLMSEYLAINKIKGDYSSLREKWTTFQELNTRVVSKLDDPKTLATHKINGNETGLVQSAAFNIIKMRDHSAINVRTHKLMNDIFKWIDADKKEFLKIGKIEDDFQDVQNPKERFDKWNDKHNDNIVKSLKKLKGLAEKIKDQQDPLTRLEEALQKLNHDDLDYKQVIQMPKSDIEEARRLANSAQTQATYLTDMFYYLEKGDEFKLEALVKEYKKRQN